MADAVPVTPAAPATQPARMRVSDMAKGSMSTGAPVPQILLNQSSVANPTQGVNVVSEGGNAQGLSNDQIPPWAIPDKPNKQLIERQQPDPAADPDMEIPGDPEQQFQTQQDGDQTPDYAAEYERLRQIEDSDDLPDDWLDKKFVKAKVNGKEERITVREALERTMLERDYSFKNGQVAARERQVETREANMQRFLGDLEGSRSFIQACRIMGKMGKEATFASDGQMVDPGSGLLGAASLLAVEMARDMELQRSNPEAYRQARTAKEREQHAWQMEMENRRLKMALEQRQAQQPPEPSPEAETTFNQLKQLMPRALERTGLVMNADVERIFNGHYMAMVGTLQGAPLTSQFIEMVCRATKQDVDAMLATWQPTNGAPPTSQGISARPVVPKPGQQRQPNGQPVRRKVSDMPKLMRGY